MKRMFLKRLWDVFKGDSLISNIKYDWDWMREYYARSQKNSRTSLKDVSELFGVPYQTIRRVAAKENWIGNVAVCRCAELIGYFPSVAHQEQYLKLAVPLAHRDYERLEEMQRFEEW
ncbi:hypothetical protein EYB33_02780 [Lysinibacillus sphaericus]|uniref:hypothetical protein n=1 Tax=Lysinibacillus sphaericus TaxID=1421 RepID=UPI001E434B3F|nr:hypothetical protein [Lysinibacillus sphaericus]UDK95242.1 hypothetical protein EYB33_02780 [Lysinibacillus sphaericus]